MALLIALVAALVLAVLVVLTVFGWVLLAPLVRMRRGNDEPREVGVEATVLFGRPRSGAGFTGRATTGVRTVPPPPSSPAAVTPAPDRAAPGPEPVIADVLVVTDDASLSSCQLAILAASGCASRCATNASDAVVQLRLRRPDLLLVDGACEAVLLVAALRAWAATETLPVVLFTPVADDSVARSAAELGVTDVVIDAQSVPRLVQRALPYWLAGVGVFSSSAG